MLAERVKVIFMLPKNYHFSSEQGSKVMQKTADIIPGTKCQRKKQSGRGTEELIYTQEGDFTCQSFSWGRLRAPPHLAMYLSQVPFPFHPIPNHSILRPSLQKAWTLHTLTTSSLIYCTYNCKTRALGKT